MQLLLLSAILGCFGLALAHGTFLSPQSYGENFNEGHGANEEDSVVGSKFEFTESSESDSEEDSEGSKLMTLFESVNKSLQSLPPPDYEEHSSASTKRTEFVDDTLERYMAILASRSSSEDEDGTEETAEEEEENEEWCVWKTEALIKVITGKCHWAQRIKAFKTKLGHGANPMVENWVKSVFTEKFKMECMFIVEGDLCEMNHMKNKTEPILQLVNETYHKMMELPPASSEANSTNWRNRTHLALQLVSKGKNIMFSGDHHHHHGHHHHGRHHRGRHHHGHHHHGHRRGVGMAGNPGFKDGKLPDKSTGPETPFHKMPKHERGNKEEFWSFANRKDGGPRHFSSEKKDRPGKDIDMSNDFTKEEWSGEDFAMPKNVMIDTNKRSEKDIGMSEDFSNAKIRLARKGNGNNGGERMNLAGFSDKGRKQGRFGRGGIGQRGSNTRMNRGSHKGLNAGMSGKGTKLKNFGGMGSRQWGKGLFG